MMAPEEKSPKDQISPAKSFKGKDLPALPSFGGFNWADEVEESLAEPSDEPSTSGVVEKVKEEQAEAIPPPKLDQPAAAPRSRNLKPAQSKRDILSQISKYIRPVAEKPASTAAPPRAPSPLPQPVPTEASKPAEQLSERPSTPPRSNAVVEERTPPPRAISPPPAGGLSLMSSRWANAPDEETDEEEKAAKEARERERRSHKKAGKSPMKVQRLADDSSRSNSPRPKSGGSAVKGGTNDRTPSKNRTPRRGRKTSTPRKDRSVDETQSSKADVFVEEPAAKAEPKTVELVMRSPPEKAAPAAKPEESPTRPGKESDSTSGFRSYAGVNEIMSSRWS